MCRDEVYDILTLPSGEEGYDMHATQGTCSYYRDLCESTGYTAYA